MKNSPSAQYRIRSTVALVLGIVCVFLVRRLAYFFGWFLYETGLHKIYSKDIFEYLCYFLAAVPAVTCFVLFAIYRKTARRLTRKELAEGMALKMQEPGASSPQVEFLDDIVWQDDPKGRKYFPWLRIRATTGGEPIQFLATTWKWQRTRVTFRQQYSRTRSTSYESLTLELKIQATPGTFEWVGPPGGSDKFELKMGEDRGSTIIHFSKEVRLFLSAIADRDLLPAATEFYDACMAHFTYMKSRKRG